MLALTYGIIIDHAIGAPGHGKDEVDGLNATDKRFISGKMCLIGTPEANIKESRMAAHAMVENAALSLAEECARLCSSQARLRGVKSDKKYAKREKEAAVKLRHYHVQDRKMLDTGM